jgi:hypothetical protein
LATPSPLQCLSNNYLLSLEEIPDSEGNIVTTYKLPTYGNSSFVGWNCTSNTSARTYYFSQTFDQNYLGFSDSGLI